MTILKIFFLAAFISGLVLAVFAMLHGVEYTRRKRNRSRTPSPFFNLPAVAAFAVGFGAVGYPLASRTILPPWAILLIAIGGGALAITGMITLLARWALRGLSSPLSEEHEIQGQLALVIRDITPAREGEIAYEYLGKREVVPARSLGPTVIPSGSDVVIDRIEDGVAFVEEWAVVEQRL
ncbi:MAG: NfeD family protein [Gemmatimonadota bacterium]|nr:NfeD family protein [Gemmatimonadota bacterium]